MSAKLKMRKPVSIPQKGKYYLVRRIEDSINSCFDPTGFDLIRVTEVRYDLTPIKGNPDNFWCRRLCDRGDLFYELCKAEISRVELFLATDDEVLEKKLEMKTKAMKEKSKLISDAINCF